MKITYFDNARQFYQLVESYLLSHESQHNLILGILNNLIYHPERFTNQPLLATVATDENLLAVAVMTPPFKLLLSQALDVQAVIEIAKDPVLQKMSVPGVMSFPLEAKTFADTWKASTGRAFREGLRMSIYQLGAVKQVPQISGSLRVASGSDRNLLIDWFHEFYEEVKLEDTLPDIAQIVERYIQNGTLYLWQDEVPVSMVGCAGQTPNGKRIAPVYTPQKYRKKGYATACVAAVSQTLLEQGWRYCFLFADTNYATANYIYQKVGYQPVSDVIEYWFKTQD